jgi:hypothetical protein
LFKIEHSIDIRLHKASFLFRGSPGIKKRQDTYPYRFIEESIELESVNLTLPFAKRCLWQIEIVFEEIIFE